MYLNFQKLVFASTKECTDQSFRLRIVDDPSEAHYLTIFTNIKEPHSQEITGKLPLRLTNPS